MLGPCMSCVFRKDEVKVIGDAPVSVCHRYPTPLVVTPGHACGEYREAKPEAAPAPVQEAVQEQPTPQRRTRSKKVSNDEAQASPAD